ncbi:DNA polymerase IV [Maritalea sp.]|uniref:DNA polymerase IV n=1 Tax=Maritalea sp. TaxID=2003361 RepID=UPI0039E6764B
MASLCRECGHQEIEKEFSRCPACMSRRTITHPELASLTIAHVDCDSFFASVEKRDNPELRDKPVIVGGSQRGVVSTCCYIARMSGVRSAMPSFQAKRLCPQAVFVKPRMAEYVKASKQIREEFDKLTPSVEPLSIDEAFLDLSGTQKLHHASPAQSLAKLAREVEKNVGVSISIGLSHNKFLAKIASDLDKPRGMALIGEKETTAFLTDKPVTIIYGIGKKFGERLERDGITRIGQLQEMDLKELAGRYGEIGGRLYYLARGEDKRRVKRSHGVKSVSNETTFFKDINQFEELSKVMLRLSEEVSSRLKKKNIAGDTVTLKLKTAGFATRTRQRQLLTPTQLAYTIYETGQSMLEKEVGMTSFRLIGIGVSGLCKAPENDPVDLIDPKIARKAAAERAMDKVRDRFGKKAVLRGKLMSGKKEENKDDKDSSKPKQT